MRMNFAEFEREVIADRTRDKVASARRKGKWTGGITSLGYASEQGRLVVIPAEASFVAQVFQWCLEGRGALEISRG
jgi:DNA invertase Pin-like site-specific DNA recombinase